MMSACYPEGRPQGAPHVATDEGKMQVFQVGHQGPMKMAEPSLGHKEPLTLMFDQELQGENGQ